MYMHDYACIYYKTKIKNNLENKKKEKQYKKKNDAIYLFIYYVLTIVFIGCSPTWCPTR